MPIYAYRCADCGHAKDVLQKLSDAPLTDCPACGAAAFSKQLTAAGFQLKGSGWYATDFKGGSKTGSTPASDGGSGGGDSTSGGADSKPAASDSGSSAAAGSAAAGCGTSCACH